MSMDAIEGFQQLGEKLDQAAESLRKSRRRAAKGSGKATEVPIDYAASQDHADPDHAHPDHADQGHPAEPIPQVVLADSQAVADDVVATHAHPDSPAVTDEQPDGVVTPEVADPVARAAGEPEAANDDATAAKVHIDLVTLEALLFTTRHPLTTQRIGEMVDVPSAKALRNAIAELNAQYESTGRSFRIEQVAGGYQMLTLPEHGPLLNRLYQRDIDSKLSRSALETLSIIAYKQPVLRAEVEAIRGVASGETIRNLMEKHLVKIAGRAEEAGRPILYGTTKRFLEIFGLNSLKELPKEEQVRPAKPTTEITTLSAPAAITTPVAAGKPEDHTIPTEVSAVPAEAATVPAEAATAEAVA